MSAIQHAHQAHEKRFHCFSYSKKLKKAGLSPAIVDIHVEAMDDLIGDITQRSGLATEAQLYQVEFKLEQKIDLLRKDMDFRFEKTDQKIENLRHEFKQEMRLQISKNTNKLLIWTSGFSLSLYGSLLAAMAKGFHWF